MAPSPHHHPRRPATDRRTLRGAENCLAALELRKTGLSFTHIGTQLGCSRQNAHQLVSRALRLLQEKSADAATLLRQLETERLDRLQAAIWTPATRGHLESVDRVLRIMERRAKLLGLDAPVKVAPTTPQGDDAYDPLAPVRELEDILARMGENLGHSTDLPG